MKIAVSAQGATLESPTSPQFGRCPSFLLVASETMAYEALENPGAGASGGAGVEAAQLVLGHGAEAVLTGHLGPNAQAVLDAAGVRGFAAPAGSVADAVRAFEGGSLPLLDPGGSPQAGPIAAALPEARSVEGQGRGWGLGPGGGRGMGWGLGAGGGRGMGSRRGRGRGRRWDEAMSRIEALERRLG